MSTWFGLQLTFLFLRLNAFFVSVACSQCLNSTSYSSTLMLLRVILLEGDAPLSTPGLVLTARLHVVVLAKQSGEFAGPEIFYVTSSHLTLIKVYVLIIFIEYEQSLSRITTSIFELFLYVIISAVISQNKFIINLYS